MTEQLSQSDLEKMIADVSEGRASSVEILAEDIQIWGIIAPILALYPNVFASNQVRVVVGQAETKNVVVVKRLKP